MIQCPDCETTLDLDEEQAELGDEVICEGCGESFEVVETDPIELEAVETEEDDAEEEDLDDFDEDEDEDEDDEEDELLIGQDGESE